MALFLKETLSFDNAGLQVISEDSGDGKGGKHFYMDGIFIQGGVQKDRKSVV